MGAFAVALLITCHSDTYAAVPAEWVGLWEEDLRAAQAQAPEAHPNLFHAIEREAWDDQLDTLISRLATLDHYEIAVELAVIMASVKDGHTRLTLPLAPGIEFMQGHSNTPDPKIPELLFHQFPLRLFIDSNGVYIARISREHAAHVGRRVVRLGTMTIDEAVAAVSPTVRHDNEMQLLHHLPMHLVLAEVLLARGVIDDRSRLEIEVEGGDTFTLTAVPRGESVAWVDARSEAQTPLYLQNTERKFWLIFVEESQTIYLQFNEVYDMDEESLAEFAERLTATSAERRAQALVVDLRNNRGGDNSLSLPLLHAIICSNLNQAGRLFTLVGRTTFSAAMMFALNLERHTNTLFAGEATGSSGNHYGDSRKTQLPNSGLTMRVSTRYHQNDFTDNRPYIPPHLPAEITMDDYINGRDPAMETVMAIVRDRQAQGDPVAGRWQGTASVGLNTFELLLNFEAAGGLANVPELEFQAPLENVVATGQMIAFQIEGPRGPIWFDGTYGTHWMSGTLGTRSRHFPFIVRRSK
jgi:hypothetical protein